MQTKDNYSLIRRIYFIHKRINECGKVAKKEVMEEFGVSLRTVTTDIMIMREDFGAKIIPSKEYKGYYNYESPFHLFDEFTDEKLIISYSFIKSILESSFYTPYISNIILKDIKEKILTDKYISLSNKIVYELAEYERFDDRFIKLIIESFMKRKKIKIEYMGLDGKISKNRIIEPLKLVNYTGNWHLVSFCYQAEEIRNFRLAGINLIERTDYDFENPMSETEIDNIIRETYGIYISQEEGDYKFITVRFYNRAYWAMDKMKLHKEQKKSYGKDEKRGDFLQIEIPAYCYNDIIAKVLQHGKDAEIISPDDFREIWINEIREMNNIYCK